MKLWVLSVVLFTAPEVGPCGLKVNVRLLGSHFGGGLNWDVLVTGLALETQWLRGGWIRHTWIEVEDRKEEQEEAELELDFLRGGGRGCCCGLRCLVG